jgi:hypothetical protein
MHSEKIQKGVHGKSSNQGKASFQSSGTKNRLIAKLSAKKDERLSKIQDAGKGANRRAHYRKKTRMMAICRPVTDPAPQADIGGEIKDISLSGVGVEVRPMSFASFPPHHGDKFHLETRLPNKKPISFTAKVVWMKQGTPGAHFLGMSFTDLPEVARKELGFFMMTG